VKHVVMLDERAWKRAVAEHVRVYLGVASDVTFAFHVHVIEAMDEKDGVTRSHCYVTIETPEVGG